MDTVVRGLVIYLFLLVLFRLLGARALSQATPFDFVLLLIISETTQQAMTGDDNSVTNAIVLIATLVGADMVLAWVKQRFRWADRAFEGRPLIILREGEPLRDRMKQEKVSEDDILAAARVSHGLERLDEVAYAVIEVDGKIAIVPSRAAPNG